MKYIVYKDKLGHYRWRLLAANNRVIADSGEGYNNKNDCIGAMCIVMDTTRHTPWQDLT